MNNELLILKGFYSELDVGQRAKVDYYRELLQELKPESEEELALFGIAFSWFGFEIQEGLG